MGLCNGGFRMAMVSEAAVAGGFPDRGTDTAQDRFAHLFETHYDSLVGYCRHLTGAKAHEAEELAQETFTKAWTAWHRYAPDLPFWPWLTTMARHIWIDRRRRAERSERSLHLEAALHGCSVPRPDEAVVECDERRIAVAALRSLRPQQRRLIGLKDIEGWSYEDIAAFEGVTVESVRGSLRRARGSLRQCFDRLAGGVAAAVGWRSLRDSARRVASGSRWAQPAVPLVWPHLAELAAGVVALAIAAGSAPVVASLPVALAGGAPTSTPARAAEALPATLGRPSAAIADVTPQARRASVPPGWTAQPSPLDGALHDGVAAPEDAEFVEFAASPRFEEDGIVFGIGNGRSGCVQECPVLFRSLDAGASWERVAAVGFQGGRIILPPSFPSDPRVFASGPAGLQVSHDGGSHFETLLPVTGPAFMSPWFSMGDPRLVVGTAPGWEYRDDVGVATPLAFTPPPASLAPTFTVAFLRRQARGGMLVGGTHPTASDAQTSAVFRCEDDCADPAPLPGAIGAPGLLTTTAAGGGELVVAWTESSVFTSGDEARTFVRGRLPEGARLLAVVGAEQATLLSLMEVGTGTSLYTSTDGGGSWREVGDVSSLGLRRVSALRGGTLLASPSARAGGGIMCSHDGGRTWERRCTPR